MSYIEKSGLKVDAQLVDFVEKEAIPGTKVTPEAFWAGLAGLVAPDAEFIVNSGDASYLSKGPTGLMSFVRFMRRPNSFQSIRRMHGPVVGDPCRRATVNLLVRSESRGAEYPARWLEFTYEGGVLQSVSGYSATVSEGTLQPTAANES